MDNLDDLASGGRVTRSLRKRLNSVDSEASSSRCGTPTNQKLPSITEISIASSRTTRANTPSRTPSKGRGLRGVTPEVNSPARRLTRRSSISTIEDEHPKTNGKDTELEALQEEGSKSASKNKTAHTKTTSANSSTKRATRRNSVVILENDELKEENLETLSDVSKVVSVSKSEGTTTSATKEIAVKTEKDKAESASPTKTVVKTSSEQLDTDVEIINLMSDESSRDVDIDKTENVAKLKPVTANDTSKQEQDETANKTEKEEEKSQEKNKPNTSPKISTEVVYIKKLKQSDIARYTSKPTETVKDDTEDTKSSTETKKSVSLNASDDDIEKKKYPKTPAITKSKSYIENTSAKDTIEEEKSFTSDRISRSSLKMSKDDTESNANEPNSSKESVEFHDATDVHMDSDHEKNKEDMTDSCKTSFLFAEKTPYKTRLSCNVKSSTPFVETVTADQKIELRERQKENNESEMKNIRENGSDEDVQNKSGNSSKHSFELDPELLTPEKCLRSGKTYGSTPPLISPRESPSLHNKSPENKAEKEKSTSASVANDTSKNSNETVEEKVVEDKTTESFNKSMTKEENSNKKDKSISDAQVVSESTESKDNEVSFTRSWSPSVSGKADAAGQKIDTITDTTELKEKVGEIIEDKSNFNSSTRERFHYEPDNDEEEEPTNENADDGDDDDDAGDDEEKEKNEFIDSEAKEAPEDYQSGDSMDEEERKDMEENDIPIDGESIGSEDTDDEDAEDDDASKDSFIVEDEEVDLLEYSDDDEYLVESKKSKSKRNSGSYRRIMVHSSDSDSDKTEKEISKSKTNTRRQSVTEKSKAALTLDVTKMIDDSMTDDDDNNSTVRSGKKAPKLDENETELKLNGEEEKDLKDDESLRLVATEESDSESMETLSISKSFYQSQSGRKSNKNVLDSTDEKEKNSFKETLKKFLNTSNRASNVTQNRDENDADEDIKLSIDVAAASKESEDESDSVEEEEEEMDQKKVLEAEKKIKTVEIENDEDSDNDDDADEDDGKDEEMDEEGVGEKEKDDKDLAEKEDEDEEDEDVAEEEEDVEAIEVEADEDTKEKNQEDEEVEEDEVVEEDEEVEEDDKEDEEDVEEKEEEEVGDEEHVEEIEKDEEVEEEEDVEAKEESIEEDKENSIRRKKKNKKGALEHEESNDSQNEAKESEEEPDQDLLNQQRTAKKRKSAGLSVSFDHKTTSNKAYEVVEEKMYSSFTIDVKVTKKPQKSLKKEKITIETGEDSNSDATSNVQQLLSSDEEEHLEKLKDNKLVTINRSQRRLTLNSSDGSVTSVKRRKLERNSICLPIDEEMPMSHSFTETISKRKSMIRHQELPTSIDEENVPEKEEVETSTEQVKEPSSSTSGSPTKPNAAKRSDNSIQNILSRCDEILDAANEAKLEAKRNFKKSKVRQRKKQSKKQSDLASTSSSADTSETIELNESMERKRKEEVKNAVEQALKASVNILLNPPDKKKIKHQSQAQVQNTIKSEEEERKLASKRLPDNILAAIAKDEPEHEHEHISHVAKKKKQTVAHKEQENLGGIKKINSVAGEFIEGPLTPTKKKMPKIKTATGSFLVEPLTPKHKTNISGFRESPLTPRTIGYKVRRILTAGQDTPPTLAASTSSSSLSSRARKRGRNIEEPTHTLPRTIWTNSGGFLEQDIAPTRHINVSGCATQFTVSALKGSTKSKKFKTNSNTAINASALQFKEVALMQSNAKRESSRELLLRKQRLNEHRSNKHA